MKNPAKPDTTDSNLQLKQVGASPTVHAPFVRKAGGLQSAPGDKAPVKYNCRVNMGCKLSHKAGEKTKSDVIRRCLQKGR